MNHQQLPLILDKIRSKRLELQYSQEYMGYRLAVSQNGYSKLELNITRLSFERFLKVCEVLDLCPWEMTNPTIAVI